MSLLAGPFAAVVLAAGVVLGANPATQAAEGVGEATAEVLDANVLVGRPFEYRITVRAGLPGSMLALAHGRGDPGAVRFPVRLRLPDDLEQISTPHLSMTEGGQWQADYRLIAWRARDVEVPAVEVTALTVSLLADAVPVPVVSVLPVLDDSAAAGQEEGWALRPARGFFASGRRAWWRVALALLAAGLAWFFFARRRGDIATDPAAPPHDPAVHALSSFERLGASWRSGLISGGQLYDQFEQTLREYFRATRAWDAARPRRHLSAGDDGLVVALGRTLLARFARVRPSDADALGDLEAGAGFVRAEAGAAHDHAPANGSGHLQRGSATPRGSGLEISS